MKKKPDIYIGTSGWHYPDWTKDFYPKEIKGYKELTYLSQFFNTVENNSSFYRIAGESTYKTWSSMTPDGFKFSLKLNRLLTHLKRLTLDAETKERIGYILSSTQILKERLGAIVIQLPSNFSYDLKRLETFLAYFTKENSKQKFPFDVAIEFRSAAWGKQEVYEVLKKYNVALVAGCSSRYPLMKEITALFAYIRMHGPRELFASKYSEVELREWADYIRKISSKVDRVYVYFNNDYHMYAIENGKMLQNEIRKSHK